ncbi:MAG: GGDEF domain-containing protein [Verrucomicrobiia bacterium]|jgi:diguanylate cyclase (GGDEF)-like protein
MDDIRYSEFQFLQGLANRSIEYFSSQNEQQKKILANIQAPFYELPITLAEDLFIRFEDWHSHLLITKLRGEISPESKLRASFPPHEWENPRDALEHRLISNVTQRIRITYRGLRRIEELRDLLRHERILEPFGILLSMQYFHRDLEDALRRASDISVSVLFADMDHFKPINDKLGYDAGDVVMKAYLEVVRGCLGLFGTAYRGVGDEIAVIIVGQGHLRAVELAEAIRKGVESLSLEYKGVALPKVTASIGVATTPPADREMEIKNLAESRKRRAKEKGRNRIVSD